MKWITYDNLWISIEKLLSNNVRLPNQKLFLKQLSYVMKQSTKSHNSSVSYKVLTILRTIMHMQKQRCNGHISLHIFKEFIICESEYILIMLSSSNLIIFKCYTLTNSLPNKLRSSSAAGHSGLLTVERRSWTKFSNNGL